MRGKPSAEVDVSAGLVRRLLEAQHPDLAALSLEPVASGWDNEILRLGESLLVRIPRREIGARLLRHEQEWLPRLASTLPLPTSAPVRVGVPTDAYPWHWSIAPWFDGTEADLAPPGSGEAEVLAGFLRALHQPAPDDAPYNEMRGVPLEMCRKRTEPRLDRLRSGSNLITPAIFNAWDRGLAASAASEKRWVHGDLHSQNVLVDRGRIRAIIDWGDINGGDVACDLVCVWSLFAHRSDRNRLLDLYAPDQALLDRGRAWAVFYGAVLLESGLVNSPRHAAQGRLILERLAEDL